MSNEKMLADFEAWVSTKEWSVDHYGLGISPKFVAAAREGWQAALAQRWLPIETAPKDKTLLLWHPSYGIPVAGHLIAGDLWAAFTPGVPMLFQKHLESPTHWMPPPQPPAMQKETK